MRVELQTVKQYLNGCEEQYTIIGGTACELLLQAHDFGFRVTKDLDMVLLIEYLSPDFGHKFWKLIRDGGYSHKSKSTGKNTFYRFTNPASPEFPQMIELFSRQQDEIILPEEAVITPVRQEEAIYSLSAILLDNEYYNLLLSADTIIEGIPILSERELIPFKANAWLDLTHQKENGEKSDSRNIKKHKNDVFRLLSIVNPSHPFPLPEPIQHDMKQFLLCMEKEQIDMKALGLPLKANEPIEILKNLYLIDQ